MADRHPTLRYRRLYALLLRLYPRAFRDRFGHAIKDRYPMYLLALFPRGNATDNVGTVGQAGFCVKTTILPGDALYNGLRILIDKDRHDYFPSTKLTIFSAASASAVSSSVSETRTATAAGRWNRSS